MLDRISLGTLKEMLFQNSGAMKFHSDGHFAVLFAVLFSHIICPCGVMPFKKFFSQYFTGILGEINECV